MCLTMVVVECLHANLNTALQSLVGGLAGTYTMDLSFDTFVSWNTLSSVPSTLTLLSQIDPVTTLQSNNFKGLSLKIATRLDSQVAVTFMDANLVNGLVTRIFNIPLGCLTWKQHQGHTTR